MRVSGSTHQSQRREPSIRLTQNRLQYIGGILVAAAVAFSLYCAVYTIWTTSSHSYDNSGSRHRSLLLGGRSSIRSHTAPAWLNEDDDLGTDDTDEVLPTEKSLVKKATLTSIASALPPPPPCPVCPACVHPPQQPPQVTSPPPPPPKVTLIKASQDNARLYHTVTTVAGFSNHWQARIHYYWFVKQRRLCQQQGTCDMGGFTRLLHTGQADDLMDEIPTVVVNPLPKSAFPDGDNSYIVLNRPFAFLEWLQLASIPEKYILMCEADHLWLRPMPNMMNGESSGAALFTYMVPYEYPDIVRKFIGDVSDEEIKTVPRIGNSPTFISIKEFRKVAPLWYNTTMDIFRDKEAHKAWNWVLEMYGYALATYRAGTHRHLKTYAEMLAHPPWDRTEMSWEMKPFYLLHLTYPMRYNSTGGLTEDESQVVWKFDKRLYSDKPPPRNMPLPPSVVKNDLASVIIKMMNEATDAIPCWDTYFETLQVTSDC